MARSCSFGVVGPPCRVLCPREVPTKEAFPATSQVTDRPSCPLTAFPRARPHGEAPLSSEVAENGRRDTRVAVDLAQADRPTDAPSHGGGSSAYLPFAGLACS
jgi:hypothetical protein